MGELSGHALAEMDENVMEVALVAKEDGNRNFKNGSYKKAITDYTKAIDGFEDHRDSEFGGDSQSVASTTDSTPVKGNTSSDNPTGMEEEGTASTSSGDAAAAPSTSPTDMDMQLGSSRKAPPSVEEMKLIKDLAICYSNRSFCHIKMENFGSAIIDAEQAVSVDPTYGKAYYRLGSAKYALFKYKDAQKAYKNLCKISPNDKDARVKLKECEKAIQQQRFASAIASENTVPASEVARKGLAQMEIEASYTGPVYPGRKLLTHEWVVEFCEYMGQQKVIHKKCAYEIVFEVLEILKSHRTVMHIEEEENAEMTVCGDVHGQYYDLLNIWKLNGYPSESNPYLFNGDFVDRGSFSIEVILSLFAWKILLPHKMHLARGNHETKSMNKLYGFEGETKKKFDLQLYNLFCETFCHLPLSHVLNDEVFIVHGGLFSQDNVTLEDLQSQNRIGEPADEGRIVEMLWSDPGMAPGRHPSRRGVGVMFGPDVTRNFLEKNNLSLVVRSHEMKDDGYELEHGGRLITIFSAPNYCDQMKNKGAFIRWKVGKHPDWYADQPANIGTSNGFLRNLSYRITKYEHVEHAGPKAMNYANPMLGTMMGM